MKTLAIIPARGGSKGLPGKNIRLLAGIPLIAYTIKAAQEAKTVDRIIVSTDDPEIAAIAKESGAEVPFLRPAELSGDNATSIDACLHTLGQAKELLGYHPGIVAFLQPTSPLRNGADIDAATKLMHDTGADSVVSVRPVTEYPQWMKKMDDEQRISPLFEDMSKPIPRQNLEKTYLLNGAIYLSTTSSLIDSYSFYGKDTRGFLMPEERSIDIDSPHDFLIAESLISRATP